MTSRSKKRALPKLFFLAEKSKTGSAPGTLTHTGSKKMHKVSATLMEYDKETCTEKEVTNPADCQQTDTITWLNVDGLHDVEFVRSIGKQYGLHTLLLEDVLDTAARPKIEEFENATLIILKMVRFTPETGGLDIEQISFLLADTLVITFQEQSSNILDVVKEHIRTGTKIRTRGADYLLYALIDTLVDSYIGVLEQFGAQIESLETGLMAQPTNETLQGIYALKRNILFMQQATWPLDEIVRSLQRSDVPYIQESTVPYLRDLEDHIRQLSETTRTFRDMLSEMLNTYLSIMSNRMNEVMKTLTIIATIFIPLTFIVGIYGMNFEYMPEIGWVWGYPAVWGIMIAVGVGMLAYFRKKNWF